MNQFLHDALVKLGTANPELRPHIRPILAGCEKLPEALRENCEKKQEEGGKEATEKTSKLVARQEAILKKYMDSTRNPVHFFDELPQSVQNALMAVKDQETLDSDVDRWLSDNNNPHLRSSSVYDALVKLGTTNPELRPHIRPILASTQKVAVNFMGYDFEGILFSWLWPAAETLATMLHIQADISSGNGVWIQYSKPETPGTSMFLRLNLDLNNPAAISCGHYELNNAQPLEEFRIPLVKVKDMTPRQVAQVFASKFRSRV